MTTNKQKDKRHPPQLEKIDRTEIGINNQAKDLHLDNPFGSAVGEVKEKHLCTYKEHTNGYLYVTTKALCFRKTILGWEMQRLVIPWHSIENICNISDDNTNSTESKQEDLKSKQEVIKIVNMDGQSFKFFIPNPPALSTTFSEYLSRFLESSTIGSISAVGAESDSDSLSINSQGGSMYNLLTTSLLSPFSDSFGAFKYNEIIEDECRDVVAHEVEEIECKVDDDGIMQTSIDPKYEMSEVWKDFRNRKFEDLRHVPVSNRTVSCTLSEFFDNFLSDDARHSIGKYQSKIVGDKNVKTSSWKQSADSLTMTRTITYIHPINAPLAPPQAKATKAQRLLKFGDKGLCLMTETVVNDVPMTDCFYVEDCLFIETSCDDPRMVSMTSAYDLRFVKSTMFQKLLERATCKEIDVFQINFATFVIDSLAESSDSIVDNNLLPLSNSQEFESKVESLIECKSSTFENNNMFSRDSSSTKLWVYSFTILLLSHFFMMYHLIVANNRITYLEKKLWEISP